MIEDITKFDTIEFENNFLRKLKNFLRNKPILSKVNLVGNIVKIYIKGINIGNFELDYTLDEDLELCVRYNIKKISDYLYENHYPTFTIREKVFSSLSVKEREELQSQGIPLEEVLLKQKEKIIEKQFKIVKVIINTTEAFYKNEIFIENLETKKVGRYSLKIPVSIFLKRLESEELNKIEIGDLFLKKAYFKNRIYPGDEWKQYLETKETPEDLFENII